MITLEEIENSEYCIDDVAKLYHMVKKTCSDAEILGNLILLGDDSNFFKLSSGLTQNFITGELSFNIKNDSGLEYRCNINFDDIDKTEEVD